MIFQENYLVRNHLSTSRTLVVDRHLRRILVIVFYATVITLLPIHALLDLGEQDVVISLVHSPNLCEALNYLLHVIVLSDCQAANLARPQLDVDVKCWEGLFRSVPVQHFRRLKWLVLEELVPFARGLVVQLKLLQVLFVQRGSDPLHRFLESPHFAELELWLIVLDDRMERALAELLVFPIGLHLLLSLLNQLLVLDLVESVDDVVGQRFGREDLGMEGALLLLFEELLLAHELLLLVDKVLFSIELLHSSEVLKLEGLGLGLGLADLQVARVFVVFAVELGLLLERFADGIERWLERHGLLLLLEQSLGELGLQVADFGVGQPCFLEELELDTEFSN